MTYWLQRFCSNRSDFYHISNTLYDFNQVNFDYQESYSVSIPDDFLLTMIHDSSHHDFSATE